MVGKTKDVQCSLIQFYNWSSIVVISFCVNWQYSSLLRLNTTTEERALVFSISFFYVSCLMNWNVLHIKVIAKKLGKHRWFNLNLSIFSLISGRLLIAIILQNNIIWLLFELHKNTAKVFCDYYKIVFRVWQWWKYKIIYI